MAPQFVFVELPSFRIKDIGGHTLNLTFKQLGQLVGHYQNVRRGLTTIEYCDLSISMLFEGASTDIWTSANIPHSLHAEENLLLSYFQSFDLPGGAFPIVDSLLLSNKPCSSCVPYFQQGKQVKPGAGLDPFRARFIPRSDRNITPVFYLSRHLNDAQRGDLWMQLGHMWASECGDAIVSSAEVPRGQTYYILPDSPWYALNDQENMSDNEIAEAISRQNVCPTYWIGR